MTSGSMREWLRPTLGAVLFLAGAAGIAYKVISGYQHAAPDAFVSVQDRNKVPAASAANPVKAPAVSADAATPPKSTATVASTAAATAPAAPPPASRDASRNAASIAVADASADVQNDESCVAIKTEEHEIEGALNKKYSPEEGRYLQRRARELTEQSVKHKCGE